jgi:hypothetical protein
VPSVETQGTLLLSKVNAKTVKRIALTRELLRRTIRHLHKDPPHCTYRQYTASWQSHRPLQKEWQPFAGLSIGDRTHKIFTGLDVFLVTKVHRARSSCIAPAASEKLAAAAFYRGGSGCTQSKSCRDQGKKKKLPSRHDGQVGRSRFVAKIRLVSWKVMISENEEHEWAGSK